MVSGLSERRDKLHQDKMKQVMARISVPPWLRSQRFRRVENCLNNISDLLLIEYSLQTTFNSHFLDIDSSFFSFRDL